MRYRFNFYKTYEDARKFSAKKIANDRWKDHCRSNGQIDGPCVQYMKDVKESSSATDLKELARYYKQGKAMATITAAAKAKAQGKTSAERWRPPENDDLWQAAKTRKEGYDAEEREKEQDVADSKDDGEGPSPSAAEEGGGKTALNELGRGKEERGRRGGRIGVGWKMYEEMMPLVLWWSGSRPRHVVTSSCITFHHDIASSCINVIHILWSASGQSRRVLVWHPHDPRQQPAVV